ARLCAPCAGLCAACARLADYDSGPKGAVRGACAFARSPAGWIHRSIGKPLTGGATSRVFANCKGWRREGNLMAQGKVIGIDLGTTNSVVAVIEGGQPTVIANEEGGRTTPSVVGFTDEGERLVGAIAKRQAVTNPKGTIYSIKRFMGRRVEEVPEEIRLVPYDVVQGKEGTAAVRVQGKDYTPPEISAMILQKLKAAAEAYLGQP